MSEVSKNNKIKNFFHSLLDDINSPYKKYFDFFMVTLIIISTLLLILEKNRQLPMWLDYFDIYIATYIFAIEYILRLWLYTDNKKSFIKSKLYYIFSIGAIIDLIAIFPQFRIIRLLKLYHYTYVASSILNSLLKKRFEFIFLGYTLIGVTFTFGSIFYLVEYGSNDSITNYLDALYWALVTISTVGYGDITPITTEGKVVSMFAIISGISMISFVTSVMVSAFSERFNELRNQDTINHINKMKNIIIINGYGHLAQTIVTKLKIKDYYQPLIVEKDKIKADMAIENGCKVIYQDASNAQTIKLLYKKQKRNNIIAMLTLKSSDIDNIYFILNTKSIKIKSIIYTRINNIALSTQYQGTKVDGMIEPYSVVDNKAFNYLKKRSNLDNRHIYFFGYTNKNQHICKSLKNENIDLTIYEINENSYNLAKDDGFVNVILIDKHKTQIADINSSIVVCSMREEALNVYYALSLSTKKCDNEIIALSDSKEDNRKLLLAGVNKIFDVYSECASQFVEMIDNNDKGRV